MFETMTQKDLIERTIKQVTSIKRRNVKFKMQLPNTYYKNTRTIVSNFGDICQSLFRFTEDDVKHFVKFLEGRIKKKISIDGSKKLLISGRRSNDDFEKDMKKYVDLFIECHSCKGHDTYINREKRLSYVICKKCNEKRYISMQQTE